MQSNLNLRSQKIMFFSSSLDSLVENIKRAGSQAPCNGTSIDDPKCNNSNLNRQARENKEENLHHVMNLPERSPELISLNRNLSQIEVKVLNSTQSSIINQTDNPLALKKNVDRFVRDDSVHDKHRILNPFQKGNETVRKIKRFVEGEPPKDISPHVPENLLDSSANISLENKKSERFAEEDALKNMSSNSYLTQLHRKAKSLQVRNTNLSHVANSSITQQLDTSAPIQDMFSHSLNITNSTQLDQRTKRLVEEIPKNLSSSIQESFNKYENRTQQKQIVKRCSGSEANKNISAESQVKAQNPFEHSPQQKQDLKRLAEDDHIKNVSLQSADGVSVQPPQNLNNTQKFKRFLNVEFSENISSHFENQDLNPPVISFEQSRQVRQESVKNEPLQMEYPSHPSQHIPQNNQDFEPYSKNIPSRRDNQELNPSQSRRTRCCDYGSPLPQQYAQNNPNFHQTVEGLILETDSEVSKLPMNANSTQSTQKIKRLWNEELSKNLSASNFSDSFKSSESNRKVRRSPEQVFVKNSTLQIESKDMNPPPNDNSTNTTKKVKRFLKRNTSYLPNTNTSRQNESLSNGLVQIKDHQVSQLPQIANTTNSILKFKRSPENSSSHEHRQFERFIDTPTNVSLTENPEGISNQSSQHEHPGSPPNLSSISQKARKRDVQQQPLKFPPSSEILGLNSNISSDANIQNITKIIKRNIDNGIINQTGNSSDQLLIPKNETSLMAKVGRFIDEKLTMQNGTLEVDLKNDTIVNLSRNKTDCEQPAHCSGMDGNLPVSIVKRHAKDKPKKKTTKKPTHKKHKSKSGIKRDLFNNTTINPFQANNITGLTANLGNLNTIAAPLENLNATDVRQIGRRNDNITATHGMNRIKRSLIDDNEPEDKLLHVSVIRRHHDFIDQNQNEKDGILTGDASVFIKKLLVPSENAVDSTTIGFEDNDTRRLIGVKFTNKSNESSVPHFPGFLVPDDKEQGYKLVLDNLKKGFEGVGCRCPINDDNLLSEKLPGPLIQTTIISLPKGVPDFAKEIMCSAACCHVNSLYSNIKKEVICHGIREWKQSESPVPHLRELWEAEHVVICSFLSEDHGPTVEYILSWLKIIIVYIVGILLIIVLICLYLTCYLRPLKQPQQNLKQDLVQLVLNKKSGKANSMGFLVSPVAPDTP